MEDLGIDLGPGLAAPLVLLCLVISAFFSSGETAITGCSVPRMHRLAQQGNLRAVTVNALLEQKDRVIGALLFGNNVVNILAASLTTAVLTNIFGDAGVFYSTIVVTVLVVIFAEVLPKTYALLHTDRVALMLAPAMMIALKMLSPLARALTETVRFMITRLGLMPRAGEHDEASDETLRGAIDLHGGGDGVDPPPERAMLRSVLDLGDLSVASVMTNRQQVMMVDAAQPVSRIIEQVLEGPFTRVPLYRDEPDNVIGVVHAKQLFRAVVKHHGEVDTIDIATVMGPPWFIPEATTLIDQLQAFRDRREHFALVIDEYGAVRGIVTLEDILEEIVGDISDEHDPMVPGVEPQPDGSYVSIGTVPVRDLNREFGWRLPEDVATTIAGLVLHEARRIPEVGQTYAFHGFRFEILGRERNQVTRLKLVPPPSMTEGVAMD